MTTNDSPSILSLFQLTDQQRAAATAHDRAVSVTAGAGSGKTSTLVGRYLALLESELPLRSLVAITFTDKAAREMRNRIRAFTTQWLAQADAASRDTWAEAFSALDAARISTIHGLCTTILRAHPAEAGLDPAFDVLDEGQSAVWRARAVEEALAWATTEPEVAQLFGSFQEMELRRLVADLLERRLDAGQVLDNAGDNQRPDHWAAALDDWFTAQLNVPAWSASLETLLTLQADKEADKLETARRDVLANWNEARQAQEERDWDRFFAALLALRGAISSGGQKGNWSPDSLETTREAMRTLRTHFDEVLARLLDKNKPLAWSLDQRVAEMLPLIQRLFEQARTIYQGYKTEAQILDFDDLEQMAVDLLAGHDAVRSRWQREIEAVLLVDEFQDTNQRQREIVYALAGFEPPDDSTAQPEAGSNNAHSKSPASLFVVGDAKQSIYRFRGADVSVFRQVQADIRASGGALINFDLTFRAHQALVDLTNALLAPLMAGEDDPDRPYDVPFSPLMAHHPEPRTQIEPPYLEFQVGLGADKNQGRLAAAMGLATRLHELQRAGQIEWQDVALLFRASTAFGVYEDALEQAGIPYITVAGRGFYDRPEVRDLLNALAAIADPADDLAMAGLLRSPTIGLSDGALYLLRRTEHGSHRSFWAALHNDEALARLEAVDRTRAEFARQTITNLHEQAGRISVAQLLKALLDATHYRAALRLVPGGERLRRNVDKLLADAHRSELVSIAQFLEYLDALGDVGARESEAPTEAGGAVQLMTIHKAKGLEFPVVVLADAGYTGGYRSSKFYLDHELGLVLNPSDTDAQPAAFRLAAWREAEQEAAEERRLLYVAATRAMDKFIVSGDAKLSTAKAHPGRLMVSGWLAQLAGVIGLNETQLPEMPITAQVIPLAWQAGATTCTLYPPLSETMMATPPQAGPLPPMPDEMPDLLVPITIAQTVDVDDKVLARESDPPPRVWRVVPPSQFDIPAWVVGSLTHVALRYWRFPADDGFIDFLRPFALEAGLTDKSSIDIALERVTTLLQRFQDHALYDQLSAAERHHEVPYSVSLDGETHSGIIDLLFRFPPDRAWTIAEFKTDRLPEGVDLQAYAQEKGYDRQIAAYVQAVEQQLGLTPAVLLVFLNVGQAVQTLSV